MCKLKKLIIYIFVFIISLNIVLACQDSYLTRENIIINDVIVASGLGAVCDITTFDSNSTIINNQTMQQTGLFYNASLGLLNKGNYISSINCDKSGTKYYGECSFSVVTEEEDNMISITLFGIFLICMFGLIGYVGLRFYLESAKNDRKQNNL